MPDGTQTNTPQSVERIMVQGNVAACDGGGGPMGHPRIYMTITQDSVMCPYCSRIFVRDPASVQVGGH